MWRRVLSLFHGIKAALCCGGFVVFGGLVGVVGVLGKVQLGYEWHRFAGSFVGLNVLF